MRSVVSVVSSTTLSPPPPNSPSPHPCTSPDRSSETSERTARGEKTTKSSERWVPSWRRWYQKACVTTSSISLSIHLRFPLKPLQSAAVCGVSPAAHGWPKTLTFILASFCKFWVFPSKLHPQIFWKGKPSCGEESRNTGLTTTPNERRLVY